MGSRSKICTVYMITVLLLCGTRSSQSATTHCDKWGISDSDVTVIMADGTQKVASANFLQVLQYASKDKVQFGYGICAIAGFACEQLYISSAKADDDSKMDYYRASAISTTLTTLFAAMKISRENAYLDCLKLHAAELARTMPEITEQDWKEVPEGTMCDPKGKAFATYKTDIVSVVGKVRAKLGNAVSGNFARRIRDAVQNSIPVIVRRLVDSARGRQVRGPGANNLLDSPVSSMARVLKRGTLKRKKTSSSAVKACNPQSAIKLLMTGSKSKNAKTKLAKQGTQTKSADKARRKSKAKGKTHKGKARNQNTRAQGKRKKSTKGLRQ